MLTSPDPPERERLKALLSDYSLDDLNSLIGITRRLVSDHPTPQQPSTPASPDCRGPHSQLSDDLVGRIDERIRELKRDESRLQMARDALTKRR
jgi:hypothetical protein